MSNYWADGAFDTCHWLYDGFAFSLLIALAVMAYPKFSV